MEWIAQHFSASQILLDLMAFCTLIGGFDSLRGNKWGLGNRFTEGFLAFAPLAVSMVGILTIVPLISAYVAPLIAPVFTWIGADPAMFSGMLLANDMGGYQLAQQMAVSSDVVSFGGMLLASMLGVNIVFNIPVAMGVIAKEDQPYMAKGMLCGFITIPFGCFLGGLAAGFSVGWMLVNLLPVLFVSGSIALLFAFAQRAVMKAFLFLGRLVMAVALLATAAGIFFAITGLPLPPHIAPVSEGFSVVLSIVLILPGAYVLVELITRILGKPFRRFGSRLGINEASAAGLVSAAANAVPMFQLVKDMNPRGKVMNFAFVVSGGFLLGDHLAFCAALDSAFVLPLLVGKLSAGLLAAGLAFLCTRKSGDTSCAS